ncbi:beta-ketoacyl-ACP synthase III [Streptomyces sp. NPDC053474]|uniref:beta-ketoacyl-ACP synthase III n=1 Tax=Streptomyces sp. NPDC053474 TaxID=3365704 RepID=UPI0037D98ED4
MNTRYDPSGGRTAVLCGLGTWLPPGVVTNDDLAQQLNTSDEWIRVRTGIRQRHIADPSMATSDLAVEAAARALQSADTSSVDAVILATTTPDHICPATAPLVASRLGLAAAAAFDVAAVCTGFLYALAAATGLISAGLADSALVIGAETYSAILDPEDRSTRAIFGDGAGAVVLRAGVAGEDGALGPFDLGSDGSSADLIMVPSGGSRQPFSPRAPQTSDPYFRMQGTAVFRTAAEAMASSARTVLDRTGWPDSQPDLLVAHQANLRIVNAVADRLRLPRERCAVNIDRVGNTAGASLPLALAHAVDAGQLRPGTRVLLTAFGGGLTWGSCALRWPRITPG